MRVRAGWVVGGAAAVLTGACGMAPLARPEIERAQAAVHGAREVGAAGSEAARDHLERATVELARALALARAGDAAGASGWAGRARADAELAREITLEEATRAAALRTEDDAAALEAQLAATDGGVGRVR